MAARRWLARSVTVAYRPTLCLGARFTATTSSAAGVNPNSAAGGNLSVGVQPIKGIDELLGVGQHRRTEFLGPVPDSICIDQAVHRLLINLIAPKTTSARVGIRGGCDVSSLLLFFVTQQRAQGDCVIYIHNGDDVLLNPRLVFTGAITNALAAWCCGRTNVAALQQWCVQLDAWANTHSESWSNELSYFVSQLPQLRMNIEAFGKRLIVVVDPGPATREKLMDVVRKTEANLTVIAAAGSATTGEINISMLFGEITIDPKKFLGDNQFLQARFLETLVIYDNAERADVRGQLRALIGSRVAVSYRGLGGCGKSHNLLRFVHEQRAAGDCVVYIHNCEDFLRSPNHVISGAILNALQAFDPSLLPTSPLIQKVQAWGATPFGVWDRARVEQDLRNPVADFVKGKGGRFIFVFDQENRLYRQCIPNDDRAAWTRRFIKYARADLVIVSASDNNEGYEIRDWQNTILQRPNAMPEAFAVKLLTAASANLFPLAVASTSFGENSEEMKFLKEHIGYSDGLAPLEVGKVCRFLSTFPFGAASPRDLREACHRALMEYRDEIETSHMQIYDACYHKEGKADFLDFLRAMATLFSYTPQVHELGVYFDRRYCAVDGQGGVVFASPWVKQSLCWVLHRATVEHFEQVPFIFSRNWYEARFFERFLSPNIAVMFGGAEVPNFAPPRFIAAADAFTMLKSINIFSTTRPTVLVLRPWDNTHLSYDGVLIHMCDGTIDVFFLQTTINSQHRDTYTSFAKTEFPRWMDLFSTDVEVQERQLKVHYAFVWVTNLRSICSNPRGWALTPTFTHADGSDGIRHIEFEAVDQFDSPKTSDLAFWGRLSINRETESGALVEGHLYVDDEALDWYQMRRAPYSLPSTPLAALVSQGHVTLASYLALLAASPPRLVPSTPSPERFTLASYLALLDAQVSPP